MDHDKAKHPSRGQLAAFVDGLLVDDEQQSVESHVSDCDSCCDVLRQLPHGELVARMRSADTDAPHGDTPTIAHPAALPDDGGPHRIPPELVDHPRYRVIKRLGAGGMGEVFQAEHRVMERPVALKVINRRLVNSQAAIERFHVEVKAAARLLHKNIVTAHDADQAGDLHFLVMEYVAGDDLASVVQRRGRLSVLHACNYAMQAAQGLQHAFVNGMVHRDIKPHNLMRTPKGTIKILDFGLARFATARRGADESTGLTSAGATIGTPDYIAPEQARDSRNVDIRADIYSLGSTLYYMLAGVAPYPQGTALEKILAHCEREPTPLDELRNDLPRQVVQIVERMMAKDAAARFQTPGEVVEALRPFGMPGTSHAAHTMIDAPAHGAPPPTATQTARATDESQPAAPPDFGLPDAAALETKAPLLQALPDSTASRRLPSARRRAARGDWLSRQSAPIAIGAVVAALLLAGVFLGPGVLSALRDGGNDSAAPQNTSAHPSSTAPPPANFSEVPGADLAPALNETNGIRPEARHLTAGGVLSGTEVFTNSSRAWIELLPLIGDPAALPHSGDWRLVGNQLNAEAAIDARLQLLTDLPEQYDVEVEFTRHTGEHSIALIFPLGPGQATFEVDAWDRSMNSAGIQQIDGEDLQSRPQQSGYALENGRRYAMRLEVSRDGAKAFLDGQLVDTYEGSGANLSVTPHWLMDDARGLGIGVYQGDTTFHSVRVRSASTAVQ